MEKIEFREFYADEYNPLILKFKKALRWIFIYVPDCGSVTGFPRIMLNFLIVMITAYLAMQFLMGRENIIELILGTMFSGFIGGVFFMKTFSFSLLRTLEQYQVVCERLEKKYFKTLKKP